MKKVKEILLIFLLALMLSLFFVGMLKISQASGSTKDMCDILTAIGTCAAAVIALFFGLGQLVQNRDEAIIRAHIVAVRLVPQLRGTHDVVQTLLPNLSGTPKSLARRTVLQSIYGASSKRAMRRLSMYRRPTFLRFPCFQTIALLAWHAPLR